MAHPRHRPIDYIFFGYFLIQIPSTLFFDTQGVYSESIYPSWLQGVYHHYLETYRDPFLANAWKSPWYLSICLLEHFICMPFFVWASISYFYGALAKPNIILPVIIYSTHTITAVLAIWTMALCEDFSNFNEKNILAPRQFSERLTLCSAYFPFFFVPLIMLFDSVRLTLKQKFD